VTHRGPFQPRPFCDSVKIFLTTLEIELNCAKKTCIVTSVRAKVGFDGL